MGYQHVFCIIPWILGVWKEYLDWQDRVLDIQRRIHATFHHQMLQGQHSTSSHWFMDVAKAFPAQRSPPWLQHRTSWYSLVFHPWVCQKSKACVWIARCVSIFLPLNIRELQHQHTSWCLRRYHADRSVQSCDARTQRNKFDLITCKWKCGHSKKIQFGELIVFACSLNRANMNLFHVLHKKTISLFISHKLNLQSAG